MRISDEVREGGLVGIVARGIRERGIRLKLIRIQGRLVRKTTILSASHTRRKVKPYAFRLCFPLLPFISELGAALAIFCCATGTKLPIISVEPEWCPLELDTVDLAVS